MQRWALLEHKIDRVNNIEIHFDFLVENGFDCLTWKIFKLPIINGSPTEIIKQKNHRLVWLHREQYNLSSNRGFVKRIDHGYYEIVEESLLNESFSLILDGKIFHGIFANQDGFCNLSSK